MTAPTTASTTPSPINPEPVPLPMVRSSFRGPRRAAPVGIRSHARSRVARRCLASNLGRFRTRTGGYGHIRSAPAGRGPFDPRGRAAMDLMDRANDRRRVYMRDRIEHKLDDALRDNVRLEQANELLKQELERDDRERDHIWSAVETGMSGRRRSGWFRRTLFLGAGIGTAYVFG